MLLNREELRELIEEHDLVTNYVHLDTQLQPNGFDVTVDEIHTYTGPGKLDFSNDEREIPETKPIAPEKKNASDEYGWWTLDPGVYKIVMNENVKIPKNLVGIAFPRSSLLRMGAYTQNAFWDGGYEGPGEFLLRIRNPNGAEIKENARINQIAFIRMEETEDGYDGIYKA